MEELGHEHFIPCFFEIIYHPMGRFTVKEILDTCHFIKFVKDEIMSCRSNVDKSASEVQLVFCDVVVQNRAGHLLHSSA